MKQLFQPDGIAVVGASSNPGKAGFVAIRNMREKGYPGKVYPVQPSTSTGAPITCSRFSGSTSQAMNFSV